MAAESDKSSKNQEWGIKALLEVLLVYKTGFVIFTLIITGLISLIYSVNLHVSPNHTSDDEFWGSIFRELSTVLLVSGVWSGAYEYFIRRNFTSIHDANTKDITERIETIKIENALTLNRIIEKIEATQSAHTFGLVEAISTCEQYNYSSLILVSKKLTIVQNDGRTWSSMNSSNMRKRFADPEKETTVILLHPESPLLSIMADKLGLKVNDVQMKIAQTVKELKDICTPTTKLKILGHDLINPHSAYLTEKHLVITPYYFSKTRFTPPIFKFQDVDGEDSYFRRSAEDILALESACKDISNYKLTG